MYRVRAIIIKGNRLWESPEFENLVHAQRLAEKLQRIPYVSSERVSSVEVVDLDEAKAPTKKKTKKVHGPFNPNGFNPFKEEENLGEAGSKSISQAADRSHKKHQAAIKKAKSWMKRTGGSAESAAREHDLFPGDVAKLKEEDIDEFVNSLSEEELKELSRKTLGSYVKRSSADQAGTMASIAHPSTSKDDRQKLGKKLTKRLKGLDKAVDKLTKEDQDLDPQKLVDFINSLSSEELDELTGSRDLD